MRTLAVIIVAAAIQLFASASAQDVVWRATPIGEVALGGRDGQRSVLHLHINGPAIAHDRAVTPNGRLRLDIDCASRTTVDVVAFDENNGRESVARWSDTPAFLLEFACGDHQVLEPPTPSVEATSRSIREALRSSDDRRWALDLVRDHPGIFDPSVFVLVANEWAERGQVQAARDVYFFGLVRFLTDLRATNETFVEAMTPAYTLHGGDYLEDMTPAQRAEAIERALVRDAETPRYYPVDWLEWGRIGSATPWGSHETARPVSDLAARSRLANAREWVRTQLTRELNVP